MLSIATSTCPRCGADRATSEDESLCRCGYRFANRAALAEVDASVREAEAREAEADARRTYVVMSIWSLGTLLMLLAFLDILGRALSGFRGGGLAVLALFGWIGGSLYTVFRMVVLFKEPSIRHRVRLACWVFAGVITVAVLFSGDLPMEAFQTSWVVATALSAVVTLLWAGRV
jgi:hypothetical protein